MRIDQFIEELSNLTHKTNVRRWLSHNGFFPKCDGHVCPITSICKKLTHKHFDAINAVAAGKCIGLNKHACELIMQAADNISNDYAGCDIYAKNKKLRNKMLKAVGLPEE